MKTKWYATTWVAILFLVIFYPLGLYLMWRYTKWNKIIKGVVTGLFAIITLSAIFGDHTPKPETNITKKPSQTQSVAKTETQPVEQKAAPAKVVETPKSAEVALQYEILSNDKTNQLRRITVYTSETSDDRVIKLNDKLLGENKDGITNLYIDYFNSKDAAKNYFAKQADDSISEAQKNEAYTHYIASMKYNTTTGYKELVKQGNTQVTLKKY